MTTLIIARHGNTFEADETPRRVGANTDIALTEKGCLQAKAIGRYLKDNQLVPDVTYSSHLQRTKQTAEIAVLEAGYPQYIYALDIFNEIDYGPDENKTEEEVAQRLGQEALELWDQKAVVPEGWLVETGEIIHNWQGFAEQIRAHDDGEVVLVVTSNGIARFAPYITGDFDLFAANHNIKISTGGLCVLEFTNQNWEVKDWNVKPDLT